MKIAVRRRLAALTVLSLTSTVAAVVMTTGESSATFVSATPAAAGNYPPQPTLVTFKLAAQNPSATSPGSGRVPLGSNVQFIRSGASPRDAFDSTVDSYAGTPPDSSQPQTNVNFSNVVDDSTGNSEGPANPGSYDVRFSDPSFVNPLDSCSACFTVVAFGPPSVATANPGRVAANTTSNVTFSGANFARGTSFSILPSTGNAATDISVVQARTSGGTKIPPSSDGKSYFATVTVPSGAALGPRDIQATNTDGQTSVCTGCFTVLGANLTTVSPTGSTNNDNDNARSITFSGPAGSMASDGVPSLEFVIDPGSATRDALRIVGTVTSRAADNSAITATFNLAAAAPGSNAYQPTVTSASGSSINVCTCRFSIVQPGAPTLTTVSPTSQNPGTTQQITVGGTNFSRGANVIVVGGGVTTTAVEYVSRTQLKASLTAASTATAGKRDLQVRLTDAQTGTCAGCYTINGSSSSPSASTSVSPTPSRSTTCPTSSSSPSTTASPTATATAAGTASPTATATASPTGTASPTATASPTGTASPTATASPTGTASPTASAPASGTATPRASNCPTATRQTLTLFTSDSNIPAGSTATLQGSGQPNQAYSLQCYSRPSTTYTEARAGSFDAFGSPVTFTVSLGRNTRCFLQYATNSTQGQSNSIVVNVRTVLSLSTVRTATRTYVFQGRNLPRVAGQLITLYRVDNFGNEIRTSNLVTDDSGIYRVTRKFTGTGTFRFKVRTSQTLNNAAGVSNTITVTVR